MVVENIKMSDQVGSEGQDVKLTANLCAPFDKIQWHKRGGFLLDEKSMFTKYSTDRGEFFAQEKGWSNVNTISTDLFRQQHGHSED